MNLPGICVTLMVVALGVLSTGPLPPSRINHNHPRFILATGLVVLAVMLVIADALARIGGA